MNSSTIEGKEILLQHDALKTTIIEVYKNQPQKLAEEIERLTFVTLRRFRALFQWPYWDFDLDEDDI